MTVRLHIDRLVVDAGLGVAGHDVGLLERAVAGELRRMLAERGCDWSPHSAALLRTSGIVNAGADTATLGAGIAGALTGALKP